MKKAELKAILEKGVKLGFISNLELEGFRVSKFNVCLNGQELKIEWWCNVCYLTVSSSGLSMPFHKFKFAGTWPNQAKTNIQLEYCDNTCAIIPVELYKKESES